VLFEVRSNIFYRNGDLVGDKICPPSIFDEISFKIINYGEVSAMNFLGSYPENLLFTKLTISDFFNKFSVRRKFNRRIRMKLIE